MATNLGTAVNFGFTGTNGITATGQTGWLLQNAEFTKNSDKEQIKDGDGDVVAEVYSNQWEEATLEIVVTGSGLAAAITNTTVSSPGTIIDITESLSLPALDQTNWVVQPGAKITGSNTTAKRLSIPLMRHAGVTAAASV